MRILLLQTLFFLLGTVHATPKAAIVSQQDNTGNGLAFNTYNSENGASRQVLSMSSQGHVQVNGMLSVQLRHVYRRLCYQKLLQETCRSMALSRLLKWQS